MSGAESDALVERLAALESGQVSDVLDEAGLPDQVISANLFALLPGTKMAGRAACASGTPSLSAAHLRPALPPSALEEVAGPGTILVLGAGGFTTGACIGGFVAYSLQREGCRGMLTDGAIRDADEIRALGFPILCAAITPVNGARRWRLTDRGGPVCLPGQTGVPVTVQDGDLILADGDGAVVVPKSVADQVVADTEELLRIERRIGEGLRAGGTRSEVFKANPRFSHIRKAAPGS